MSEGEAEVAVIEAPVVVEGEAPAAEVQPEPVAEVVPPKEEKQVPLRVMLERIGEANGKRQRAEELAAAAERRAAEAEALAERLAKGEKTDGTVKKAATKDDEADIDARAEYKLFMRDVESVRNRGVQTYGTDFQETIKALGAVGADNDAFIQQVLAVDPSNAHVLLNGLAQDLEKTASLVAMNPNRRIAELTRMSMAATAPEKTETVVQPAAKVAPKTVSKAPAPAPAIAPSASKAVDWRTDAASDADFDAGFKEMMAKRRAIR